MPVVTNLEQKILQLIRQEKYSWFTTGVNFGGDPGPSGGSGVPPGGFTGQLIQSRVTYDTSEASSLDVPVSLSGASLLHNLNRIRYWLGVGGAATSIGDGGTIAHGLSGTPSVAIVSPSVASEMVSVTGLDGTNITVAIKKDDGTAGTSQTIYWRAYL
jgi:hypothetical protein